MTGRLSPRLRAGRWPVLLASVVPAIFAAASASAHHSFFATYDDSREITIEGELVQFSFRNPHAWVHMKARDENGEMQRWGVEWGGAGQLSGQGVRRDSLQAGDRLVITGHPGRDPVERRLSMISVLRPSDGFGWGFEGETFD